MQWCSIPFKGSVTLKKWKNEIMKKIKLYICFTADLKIYFIFKKALYYCIYLWRIFLLKVINLTGLPDVYEILTQYSCHKSQRNPHVRICNFVIFRKLWCFEISKAHNFRKIKKLKILTWGFLSDLWQEYCVKISSTSE